MGQIGTIRVDTQSNGTVSVPIFDTGDSGSDVYEFLRVQTAGGTGFIPLVDPVDASFDYLRVQSQNQGVVAVHNDSALIQVIDDFEDGDMNEYTEDVGNNGDTFSVETGRVFNGTFALEMIAGNNTPYALRRFTSEAPSAGDEFNVYAWVDTGTNDSGWFEFAFGNQSFGPQSSEGITLDSGDPRKSHGMRMSNHDTGSTVTSPVSYPHREWSRWNVDMSGGNVTWTVFDSNENFVDSLTVNEPDGGDGYQFISNSFGGGSSLVYWDFFHIL